MLLDFVNLNFFKKFVDEHLDHKTILDINDPWTENFVNSTRAVFDQTHSCVIKALNTKVKIDDVVRYIKYPTSSTEDHHNEVANGLVLVEFVPTSENLCKWLFDIVHHKLGDIVKSVSFSETPKTLATYTVTK